jgi:exodeoxyribonuclease III
MPSPGRATRATTSPSENRHLQRQGRKRSSRGPCFVGWTREADVVVLQELKAPDAKFPAKAIEAAPMAWFGMVKIMEWRRHPGARTGAAPDALRSSGKTEDEQSRVIEAIVDGVVIGGIYLPHGNPYPGPKFDYNLCWFPRLHDYAAELLELEVPVVLVGDYNVMLRELDVYKPERWTHDVLFRIEVREAFQNLVAQGWTDALRQLHPGERTTRFGTISGMPMDAMRV